MFEGCGGCCLSVIVIPLLCVALVACVAIYVVTNAPDEPLAGNFTASAAEAAAFDRVITNATNQASSQGWWAIKFTEREFSSWMALEGEALAEEHDRFYPFKNVQVGLDDGQITFYAEIDLRAYDLPLEVVVAPQVNTDGQIAFDITDVNVSGIKAPDVVLETITDQLQDALIQPFDDLPGNYFIYPQTLIIDNGTFEVQGAIRP